MNQHRIFTLIFSVLTLTTIYGDYTYRTDLNFSYQSNNKGSREYKSYHDFSHSSTDRIVSQKPIQPVCNQLDTIKTVLNNNFPYISTTDLHKLTNHEALAKLSDQIAEYHTLSSIYRTHIPSLSNAIDKRLNAYNTMSIADASRYTTQTYVLNDNVKQLLHKHGHKTAQFDTCFGNTLEHVIHQESLDILKRVDCLSPNSLLYDHQDAFIDFTVAMVEYNHEGMTDKATQIGDLCWTLLDFGQAVVEGAALGVYSAVDDILTNPIEATVCIIAGKQVLAYQLCKVLYNVADIGLTAVSDWNIAKEKWNSYTQPINDIINAISNKELSLRDAVKGGTAFVVGLRAQNKLLGGLGKFCNVVKQKSINFIQKNPLLKPQEYLVTPEGLLFKATNNIKPPSKTASTVEIKNSVERKAARSNNLNSNNSAIKPALTSNSGASTGIIQNITKNLKDTIVKYEDHIFSPEHIRDGIMALGKDKKTIMNSMYDMIMSLDKKGLLQEGPNQMRVMINGIDNVEIRCFIQNGEVISANAFISDFSRIFNNFLDMTKA